jgi:hypothetical protein
VAGFDGLFEVSQDDAVGLTPVVGDLGDFLPRPFATNGARTSEI